MRDCQLGTCAMSRHNKSLKVCYRKRPDLDTVHVREPETECLFATLEAALDGSGERHGEESPETRYIEKKSCADASALRCQKRGRSLHVGESRDKTRRPSVNRGGFGAGCTTLGVAPCWERADSQKSI